MECCELMPLASKICGALILAGYVIFGVLGIALERALSKHTQGIESPVQEDVIATESGRRLFRWDKLWRQSRILVWLVIPVLIWLLCGKCV